MAFNGIEIDIWSLRDSDCILVTNRKDDIPPHILIDRDYASDFQATRSGSRGNSVVTSTFPSSVTAIAMSPWQES